MILFCFISLLGTASAEEIIDNNIASNDASIDIDIIESPIHEDISISTVKNSDVSADDSSTVNGSASKGKLTANELGRDWDLSGATVQNISDLFASGTIQSGDTIYLGNQSISSTWSQWTPSQVITVNVGNIIISGGSSSNPDGTSTINANEAKLFNVQASGVTFTNIKFTNSQGGDGPGAAINLDAADCTIQNCEFDGCQVKYGAAIYGSASASNTQITNCNFTNNVGRWGGAGGAIYLEGSGCKITDSNFDGNTADSYGAIYSDSDLDIANCNFTNSKSGIVYIYGDSEIQDCNFDGSTDNSAVHIDGTAKVSNSNFTNNVATNHDGGALYIYGENSVVDNCNFNGNSITTDYNTGGALYLHGSNSVVNNSKFDSNNGNAAAISVEGSDITIENSEFTNNVAPSTGGAIYVNQNNVVIKNSNFTDNSASSRGGAIFINDDCHNADMTGCNFTGNTAGSGTAIYCDGTGNGKVTDCDFGVKPELNVNNGYPVLTLTLESDYAGIIVGNIEGGPSGGSTVPEANETITLEIFDSTGTRVATVTGKTDENGQMKYDYSHLPRGNYTYKATYMDGQTKEGPLNMGVVQGDNFSAIQAAINAAEPGSVIFLEGKTYYNDIRRDMAINKPITIIGTDGTVLDAENISRIFTIANNIDNVNLNNITFINGNVVAGDGGAIYVGSGSDNLNLVNCNFTNNHVTGYDSQGGALFISGGANNGNIINSIFDNNTADIDGGAIRNDGGWGWNIYNTSFTNNSAVIDGDSKEIHWGGGAIWTCNAPMTIYNSNFTENNGTYGGAIRGAVSTYECLFDNNTATNGNGGAIDVTTDAGLYDKIDLEFVNTTFVNNDAKGSRGQDRAQGGGIHIYHLKEIDMYGCYCENNTADRGGAIDFYELERTHVENCTILNNNASSEGGGMAIFCNQSTFKDTNVSNNNAGTDGGAIWVIGHNALFDNITSINNTAERGGSSFINGSDTTVINCNVSNNTAVFNPENNETSGLGGGFDVIGDNCKMINVTSEDNNAYRGGAAFIRGDNTIVYNSTFDNNNATLRGGGLDVTGTNCLFENVTLSNCHSDEDGGAVYISGDDNRFVNVTSVNNTAVNYGGSSYIGGTNNSVENCTLSNNVAYNGGGIFIEGDESKFTNNNITFNKAIATDEDHDFNIMGGGVFIMGGNSNFTNNNISSNHAKDNGGGVQIFFGPNTVMDSIYAFNNTAENGGFANLLFCDNLNVTNSTFYSNHATGDISLNRGEGGAFHMSYASNIDVQGNFSYNTATNGSAIYSDGSDIRVHDSSFFDNQAHSWFLLITPSDETYLKGEDVIINISHIGGDNIANALHNRDAGSSITVNNITYPFYNNGVLINKTTPNEDIPVEIIGYENSDNGNLIYIDDLEDNQVIYYNITNKDTKESILVGFNKTDISGTVSLKLSNLPAGNYVVSAYYPETTYYTEIRNVSSFKVIDVDMVANKTVDNQTSNVGDIRDWNVTIWNDGKSEAENVRIIDFLPNGLNLTDNIRIHFYNGTGSLWNNATLNLSTNNLTFSVYNKADDTWINGVASYDESSNTWTYYVLSLDDNRTFAYSVFNQSDYTDAFGEARYYEDINSWTYRNISYDVENADWYYYTFEYDGHTYVYGVFNETYFIDELGISNYDNVSNHWNYRNISYDATTGNWHYYSFEYCGNTFVYSVFNESYFVDAFGTARYEADYWGYQNISYNETDGKWYYYSLNYGDDSKNITYYIFNPEDFVEAFGSNYHYDAENNTYVYVNEYYDAETDSYIRNDTIYNVSSGIWIINGTLVAPSLVAIDPYEVGSWIYENISYNTTDGKWYYYSLDYGDDSNNVTYYIFNPETFVSAFGSNYHYNAENNTWVYVNAYYDAETDSYIRNDTIYNVSSGIWTINNELVAPSLVVIDPSVSYISPEKIYLVNKISLNIANRTDSTDISLNVGRFEGNGSVVMNLITNVTKEGNFTNIVNVTTDSPEKNYTNNVANNTTNASNKDNPELTIIKIANDVFVYVGNTTSFTIVVTNTGDCNLTDVVVTDTDFTKGLAYDHYTNNSRQWTYDGRGHWTLVNGLENGTSANFTVYFNVTANGTLVNNVSAKSNLTNETNGTNQTRAYRPNMTVQKIANDNVTYVGNQTSFTIVVTNTGDCNLTDVVVTDTDFTKGLVYDHYTNSSRQWTYDGKGHWTLVNGLENGTSANFTVFFNVTVNGTLVNNVSAKSNLTNETNGTNQTRAYLPNMTVQKIANDNITYVGNTTSFTIVVTNTGDCNLTDVVVTDTDFTKGLVYDHYTNSSRQWTYDGKGHWTLVNGLENGTSANFTVFFNVTVNGTLVNNVSAKSNLTNETNGTNQTRAYLPNMTVQKIANDNITYVGNTTSFTIVVTNTGDCNLSEIVVTDEKFSSGLIYKEYKNTTGLWNKLGNKYTLVGDLAPGASASFTIFFDVNDNGTLVNNVSAVSNLTNETNGTNNTTAYRPNMTVQKIANDNVTYVGNITSFTIVVTNTGDCNLTDVVVTDTDFTKGLVYDHYTNSSRQWTYDGAGHWTLVNGLENGTSANFTVFFNVTVNGTLVNNVSAKSNLTNETNGTNQTRAYLPNMTVQKIANDNVTYVGNITSFTIVVTNTGDCNLTDVVVTDTDFTKGLVYDHYTNSSRQWTYDGAGHWTLVNGLENGTSANFTVFFNVTVNGTLVNNVSAKSNLTNETNGTNQTRAYLPNMTVQKIANDNVTYVGNITSFTIVVTNTGDCNLSEIVVTDEKFSSGLIYKEYKNTTGLWNKVGDKYTLVGDLAPGASASFTIFFDVNDNGTLVNNVSAVSNLTNETNGTNNTTAYRPNMTIQKIANDDLVYVGNTTSFTIVVTNTGDCNLSSVVVTDKQFSSGLRYKDYTNGSRQWTYDGDGHWTLDGILTNGSSANFTVIFDVISNGTLVNNVSAKSNLTNETNGTNNTTAKAPNMTVQKISIDKIVPVGTSAKFEIVVTNTGDCELDDIYVIDTDHDEGLVYLKYENGTRNWNNDVDGRWDLVGTLGIGQNASFIIYFNVTANGTLVNNVTAGSNLTNETNGTNSTSSLAPNMTVQKIANDNITYIGNVTSFTIVVRNTGEANLTNIIVSDTDYSEGLVFNGTFEPIRGEWTAAGDRTWSLGFLEVGDNASFTVYFNVTANGTLVNNVSAHSDLTNETNGTNETKAYAPNMTVQKIANDDVVYVGNTTSFTIVVTNTGDCNLSDVVVTDKQFSSGLVYKDYTNGSRQWTYDGAGKWTLDGVLTNGSSASFTVIFDVIDNGTLVNNVSASSNLTNETNGTNNTTAYRPNMTVQKIANDDLVYVGNTTSFDIVVTNTGDCNLSDVVVTDKQFSSGLVYKDYTNGTRNWNYDGAGHWTLDGVLTNGSSASFTVFFVVISNGTLVNNVSAKSNLTNETNGTNNTTSKAPNMTVQKIANDDVVYVGNTTSFDIVVTNTGDCNLSDVVVTDDKFSSGLRYKEYTNGTGSWNFDESSMTWTLVGSLENGTSASFTVVFDVIDNGTLVNNVSASSNLTNETNGTNNTTAYRPNMTVQKIANDDVVYVGNTTSFTIVVTNTGDCNLSDVVVTDKQFSSGLVYKDYTNGSRQWTYDGAGKWTLDGVLTNGSSASFTVIFDVIDNGTLVNNVSASSNLTNETNGTNNTTAYRPNMTVQKIANDDLVYVGNITSFTIIVNNTGDCNLSDVVVTDKDFSSGLRYKEYTNGTGRWNYNEANKTWTLVGSLENGTSADFTVFFEVISNGTLVNNVSASSNLTNETNGTNNTTAKAPNMTVQKISIDKVVPVGNTSRFEIVVSNTGDCVLSDIYVIDTDHDEGLVYLKYENGTRTWNYDGNGRWDLVGPLGINKSASFIIYFNVTANGTLRNNVTAGSNLTNETNGTNVTTSLVPNMTIEKIANQKVTYVGNTTSFTIIVRNTGEANLTNILVTDKDFSKGLEFNGVYEPVKGDWTYNGDKTWSLASLNVGEDASFTVYFNVTLNGTLVNNASAHSDLTNETNATNDTRAYQPNLTVRKITYNEVVYVGEHVSFTIMVYNTGDCELSNVTVKETWFSEGLVFEDWAPNGNYGWDFNEDEMTWTMKGILTPFENNYASFIVYFNVTQNGTLKNNVSASSNLTNETNSSNETHAYDPKMTIEKIANDDVVYVGNITSFTIVVTNTGDCELSEIVVTDDKYSDGLEYSKYENSSRLWNYVDGKWNLVGSLAPGESANLTVFFTVISNGTLNNTATAVSNLTNETNSTNNTTAYKPDITVLKIANDDVVYVGNVTSFTILVINTGDCDLSGIYVIDDDFSGGLKYNRYENGTGKWTYNGERFTLVGDLAAGESANFTVFFDVVENGTLVNNVSAGSNLTNETNNTNNTTAKPVCDVIIYKEVNTSECLVGDLVEWTITVVNVGPSTALDVIVKDVLSKDLELVSANSTSYNNATGKWTVGDLKVNTPVSLTLVTRVLASGTIYNNATVNTTTEESNYTNNNASNKTDAKALCDLVITKAVNQSSCNVSDIIQWNITVTNLGPHSASDVIVKDLLPDGLELISYNVSIGNFNDVISEWSIGTLDKDQNESLILVTKVLINGTIVNIATVNTTTPDLDYTNNEANNTTVAENICDLEVIKIVNSKKVYIGDLLTWTIRVTNNGPSEALDVCVSDILPEGLIFVNYKATTGKYDDVSGTWTVGKLASGSSATLDLITRIDELGNITNPVSVNTTTPESNYSNNKANNTTEALPIVDLVLDKSSDKAKYNVNDTMHWIIKVTNRGPCDAIDAYVLDVLPKGTKFISYEATKGTYDETTGVWSIGDIANGEEVSIDILCKALLSGNFTNNATVYNNVTDTNISNNYDNSTVEIIEDTPEPGPNPNPEPVPDEPIPNEPPVTMLKTGNPLVVLLLALIAMAGTLGLRRRKE